MPAYSFQARFVPFVKDGSKPQTIRKRRKTGFAKPGAPLYLYYGLRTKQCIKLRTETCISACTIVITKQKSLFLFDERLSETECDQLLNARSIFFYKLLHKKFRELNEAEKNDLAFLDGFRPEGTTINNTAGAFELMIRFWSSTHDLPFVGDLIKWHPAPVDIIQHDYESISKRLVGRP